MEILGKAFEVLMEQIRKHIYANPDADQVIGIRTTKGNHYFVISHNAQNADFTEENACLQIMAENGDTQVFCYEAMWTDGTLDMCSWNFRTKLLAMNPKNENAYTILQGYSGNNIKQLKNLMPPKKRNS